MARRAQAEAFHFEGFEYPTTTPVPDVIFDAFLSRLGEAELKALLYIVRRTFGFKKDRDAISFNQFLRGIKTREGQVLDEGCGVKDRTTLSRALQSLEAMGIIRSEKGIDARGENETTVYSLRFKGDAPPVGASPAPAPEVVGNSYHPAASRPGGSAEVVGNSYQGGGGTLPGVVGIPYYRGRENLRGVVGNAYPQQTELQETERQDLSNIRKGAPFFLDVDNSVDNSVDNANTCHEASEHAPNLDVPGGAPVSAPPEERAGRMDTQTADRRNPIAAAKRMVGLAAPGETATLRRVGTRMTTTGCDGRPTREGLASARVAAGTPSPQPRSSSGLPANEFAPPSRSESARDLPTGDAAVRTLPVAPTPVTTQSSLSTSVVARDAAPSGPTVAPSACARRNHPPQVAGDEMVVRYGQPRMFPLTPNTPETGRGDHVIAEPVYDGSRELLARFVEDFAREFNDQAPMRSTLSRLANLYGRSGLPMEAFVGHLYAARQTTQERTGAIRARAGEGIAKNKMVYFFGVLENRLGLSDHSESSDLAAMLARSSS